MKGDFEVFSDLKMTHPYNTFKQYLKINKITIYLIYKMVVPTNATLSWIKQSIGIRRTGSVLELPPNSYEYSSMNAGF
jgi:hypothetical protein